MRRAEEWEDFTENATANVAVSRMLSDGPTILAARGGLYTAATLGPDVNAPTGDDGAPSAPKQYWRAGMRVGQAPIK